MAMCEEATFVFSVGATQRAMMPFVACRKAPPGTVLVAEVGLINVKRDGGRRQEVNDFLTQKFVAEQRQKKLDRLDEQKFMRLRLQQERKEKTDTVMKLLKANIDKQADVLEGQKDEGDLDVEKDSRGDDAGALASTLHADKPSAPVASKQAPSDAEEWEEEPEVDYEGFGESDDFFAQEGDQSATPLNVPKIVFQEEDDEYAVGTIPVGLPPSCTDRCVHFWMPEPIASFPLQMPSGGSAAPPEIQIPMAQPSKAQPSFISAPSFAGTKLGYVFKSGHQGLGYYLDVAPRAWVDDDDSGGIDSSSANFGRAPWDPQAAVEAKARASLSAPLASANDPWASIDAVDTYDTRARDAAAAAKHAADAASAAKAAAQAKARTEAMKASRPKAATPPTDTCTPAATKTTHPSTLRPLLETLGLGTFTEAFEAAGLGNAAVAAELHRNQPQVFAQQLTKLGLKMGQRQKVALAISSL